MMPIMGTLITKYLAMIVIAAGIGLFLFALYLVISIIQIFRGY